MIKTSARNIKTSKRNRLVKPTPKLKPTPKPTPKLKPKVKKTIRKKNKPENKNKPEKDANGDLDEKGNPYPIEDPEGGSKPICPPGYKIDDDFDPFNDPINPLFRCIPDLKEPDDGLANSLMNEMNQSSNNGVSIKNDSLPIPDDDELSSGGGRRRRRMTPARMRTRRRPRYYRKK